MQRVILLLVWFAVCAAAQTSVWKVTYAGKTLYLGGTVHILRDSDYPLPAAFDQAFASADSLVFETDIAAMNSPEAAMQIQALLMYGPSQSLRDTLHRKTYLALKKYAVQNGVPMQMLERMKPPLVIMTLMNLELQRFGLTAPGVDQYYFSRASLSGKRVQWFESVREQVEMLSNIGREDADGMIMENLEELKEYKSVFRQMLSAWRDGKTDTLMAIGRKFLMNESPADYRRLIVERNRKWMAKLKPMLQSRETEFVLVGALHLVGPEGLIAQLKRQGYRVEQL